MSFVPVENNTKSSFVPVGESTGSAEIESLLSSAKGELDSLSGAKTQEKPSMVDDLIGSMRKRSVNAMLLGPMGFTTEDALENQMPLYTGTLGAIGGSYLGHPNLGLGIGTSFGKGFEALADKLKGNDENVTIEDALGAGALATFGGKIFDFGLKTIGLSTQLIPEKARARFFDKALQAVNVGHKQLKRNWDHAVTKLVEKYPDQRINFQEPMQLLKDQIDGFGEAIIPQLKAVGKRNPKIAQMIEDPSKAIGITLKEAQEIKNTVTSLTGAIIKRGEKGTTTPIEREVFNVLDKFDDAITGNFKEMIGIKQAYRAGKEAFKLARPLVEKGTPVESSIFSKPAGLFGLGGTPFMRSTQEKLAFEKIASMTEAGEKMFKATRMAYTLNRAADSIKRMGEIVGGTIATKKIFESIGREQN